jgi:hypothetical protein
MQVALSPETATSVLVAVDVYNSVVPPNLLDTLLALGEYTRSST